MTCLLQIGDYHVLYYALGVTSSTVLLYISSRSLKIAPFTLTAVFDNMQQSEGYGVGQFC